MWTPDALLSEAHAWKSDVWRAVESQAKVSTMRLTETLAEQQLLEDILERSKPPIPPECEGLHFLLATPFRYRPPYGSRFRRPDAREGVFYAAEAVETAIAETSFYKFLFFVVEAPGAKLPARAVEHTAFSVRCATALALTLCAPPLDQDALLWRDPVDYAPCQGLADQARQAGIEVIRYASVRDPRGGTNCALLSPATFAAPEPKVFQTWHIQPSGISVRARCENPPLSLEFQRENWSNDPRLAAR
jgi:RES domain